VYSKHRTSFLPAIFSTTGRIDAEFLRLLFYHAHRESEEFFRLTGQLAQPLSESRAREEETSRRRRRDSPTESDAMILALTPDEALVVNVTRERP